MTEKSPPSRPPPDAYIAGPDVLGFAFTYPPEYLECIEWDYKDIDAGGDGHALGFLTEAGVKMDLTFVRKATHRRLVPFARGDNGDALYCFDGKGTKDIYVINLGEKHLRARNTGCANFVSFINDYRSQLDLPKWSSS